MIYTNNKLISNLKTMKNQSIITKLIYNFLNILITNLFTAFKYIIINIHVAHTNLYIRYHVHIYYYISFLSCTDAHLSLMILFYH